MRGRNAGRAGVINNPMFAAERLPLSPLAIFFIKTSNDRESYVFQKDFPAGSVLTFYLPFYLPPGISRPKTNQRENIILNNSAF